MGFASITPISFYWKGTFLPGLLEFSNVWLWILLNKKSIFIGKLRFIEAENQQYSSDLYRPDSFLIIFTRYAISASRNSPWSRQGARYLHFYKWADETEKLRTFSTVGLKPDAQDSHSVTDSLHQGSHRGGRCVMSGQVSGGLVCFLHVILFVLLWIWRHWNKVAELPASHRPHHIQLCDCFRQLLGLLGP